MIENAIEKYGIDPVNIFPVTDKVFKVSDGSRNYAFKKTQMNDLYLDNWKRLYEQSNRMNFQAVLPVYLTRANSFYVKEDDHYFYLSSWIEEADKAFDIDQSFKLIGEIHNQTKSIQSIITETFATQFQEYLDKIDHYKSNLISAVRQFEQKHYMSPFDLLVCTHYKDIESAITLLKNTTEKYIDISKEKSTTNISLCHGQLIKEHFIQSQRLFIINWEKTKHGHAFEDIFTLLDDLVSNYRMDHETITKAFKLYLQENELDNDELYLLIIYLIDCQDYLEEIRRYLTNERTSESMINQIVILQKNHRRLMLGMTLAKFVSDWEMDLEEEED